MFSLAVNIDAKKRLFCLSLIKSLHIVFCYAGIIHRRFYLFGGVFAGWLLL
jgi:hypothetical protein